jgi:NADPH2 dehydrogenase
VTDAVHRNDSFIYLQLWAIGRVAELVPLQKSNPNYDIISASNVPLSDEERGLHSLLKDKNPVPRPLTSKEINDYFKMYAHAALNAIEAGFDGMEIHGASGYFVDQFLQDVTNKRNDEYGGSIENRSRFGLEVVDAVCNAIGAPRTGIRLSPWSLYNGNLQSFLPTLQRPCVEIIVYRDENG